MRKPFIAGNWKMNLTLDMAQELTDKIAAENIDFNRVGVALIPSYTNLYPVYKILKSTGTEIRLGSQNVHFEKNGAYTGEVSVEMLKSVGCTFALLGHSERRNILGETDELINKKLHSCIDQGLDAIVCVGETLNEREAHIHKEQTVSQVGKALKGIEKKFLNNIIIAYEPVWAIGTGKTAGKEDAEEIHSAVRDFIKSKYGEEAASEIKIIYGGSVKPENIKELINMENIDGALVGGASLKFESFSKIIQNCTI
ncbi:triosephosphate isomerase [Flexistipes sinusarabici DSM 4947]|uniref:Triosephosphate isomerase n=1 Tax=Flexistipes sinusarabici (strain ATCC 49648 / DSM 4947 / MAS 10) TaxID=717231 RepID=F8EA00_FLESM|nr:triose-phosphate isomerase [Flexistipes sinusarabici]AEI15411.1 triosephosphate isomerase [Flexistipes sinusarabici DSM 4947]